MRRLTILLLLAIGAEAAAHPDLISDAIDDARQISARPAEQRELQGRYAIRGTFFFGSPVHEEMTIRSIERAAILGRPFRAATDAAFVRGVFWNDDPTALLWPDDTAASPDTWGARWYGEFDKAKKQATDTSPAAKPIGIGDSLLGRSHFGDLQFLHGMASSDGIAAQVTHARIMMWAEFAYKTAIGEIAAGTRLSAVPVAGIAELFKGDAGLATATVQDLFKDKEVRRVAAGSLLHLIQDAFADGHVERERTDRETGGRIHFGRGAIRSFHSYTNQDEKLHARDDRLPATLALGSAVGTGQDPVTHGAVLLRLMFAEKRPDGRIGADWRKARGYLLNEVFHLPEGNRNAISGPGAAYARSGAREAAAGSSSSSAKVALLVGVGEFKNPSISRLQGPVNDVMKMKSLLITKYGFREDDIRVLLNKDATREAILSAFDDHLYARAAKDAAVIFYFSGHGSQMTDLSGDEPDDGMDETLLAYDSRTPGTAVPYITDIVDDEINEKLGLLAKKTRNIVVILDSCHSGTAMRAAISATAKTVPPDPQFASPRFPAGGAASRNAGERNSVRDSTQLEYVLVSGSRSDELSYEAATPEGIIMGALTYQLTRVLEASTDPKLTYRALWEEVRNRVNAMLPAQHPQVEGQLDRVVLGIEEIVPKPHFLARAVDANQLIMDGGAVHGVAVGSRYAVHQPGASAFDTTDQLGVVQIEEVTPYSSRGRLSSGALAQGVLRAVEFARASGEYWLRLAMEPGAGGAGPAQGVRASLSKVEGLRLVGADGNPHLIVRVEGDMARVLGVDGQARGDPLSTDAYGLKRLEERLLHWRKWHRVLDVENRAAGPEVSLEVARSELRHGDMTAVVVRNNSRKRQYFSLIDLAKDGEIDLIKLDGANYLGIEPGRDYSVEVRFAIPGSDDCYFDVLKLVATDEPVDFSALKLGAARVAADTLHPLAELLGQGIAGRQGAALQTSTWTTRQALIKVTRPGAGQCS